MNQTSPLDGVRNQIERWVAAGKSYRQIARLVSQELGTPTSERSIRRAVRRWDVARPAGESGPHFEKAGFSVAGDEADITSDPREWKSYLNDTAQLLRERGLDPDEWTVQSLVVNEWDSPTGETLKQLKVHCKRTKPLSLIVPARVSLGKVFRSSSPSTTSDPELVVCVGDHHAPYHDVDLHKRFCQFLHEQVPERGVLMGDLIDLAKDSRHPAEPDWDAETQECLDAGSQILVDYREASPDTIWVKLPGNHLERLRRIIIDRLGHWYGLSPAKVESLPDLPPIHDPAYLLRLDELDIEYIRAKGSYQHAQYMVSPYLAAKHGAVAKRGSGTSALTTLAGLDHSIIMGHTHRQSLVQKTVAQIDGSARLLQAAETGCMCQIRNGLGYNPGPDWSNGYVTASVWPEGLFKLDHATYVDSRLYWRDLRY